MRDFIYNVVVQDITGGIDIVISGFDLKVVKEQLKAFILRMFDDVDTAEKYYVELLKESEVNIPKKCRIQIIDFRIDYPKIYAVKDMFDTNTELTANLFSSEYEAAWFISSELAGKYRLKVDDKEIEKQKGYKNLVCDYKIVELY